MNSFFTSGGFSFILVFLEGFISFFSPCIIPLIPIYMGYLAGNTDDIGEDGSITYNRKKVFFHTISFVFGISFAFFLLGISFTAIGSFFQSNKLIFTRIAGIIIIVLGLFQIGMLDFKFLKTEKKFRLNLLNKKANPIIAFLMGFTFSFAWTPCVGPALSSVLIMASSASSALIGNVLVLLYAIGFIIPFLLLGLFTTKVLNFLETHQNFLKYTVKVGGVILIIMGIMTYTGWLNGISGYLNNISSLDINEEHISQEPPKNEAEIEGEADGEEKAEVKEDNDDSEEEEKKIIPAIDFTLVDQYGVEHTLSDYKGKVVFLNFWATWCPPCQKEMPDIEELYNEYEKNEGDVIFLGVAAPKTEENSNTRELDKEGIISFLKENGYTFPVVFDMTGEVYYKYRVASLPTTYLIDKNGNIHGYAPGMLTKEIMENIIKDTLKATEGQN